MQGLNLLLIIILIYFPHHQYNVSYKVHLIFKWIADKRFYFELNNCFTTTLVRLSDSNKTAVHTTNQLQKSQEIL